MRQPTTDDEDPSRDLDDLMQRLHRRFGLFDPGRAIHCDSRRYRRARH